MTHDHRSASPAEAAGDGSAVDPQRPPHPAAVPFGLGIVLVVVVLDQVVKTLVESWLEPGVFVPWLGEHIGWQLVYNPGAAFGIPAPWWLFLLVTVIVLVVVVRTLPSTPTLLQAGAYALLLAGALGNVIDRLFRAGSADGPAVGGGHVVDFVAWGSFPRFNVADSAITVGFVLLVIALLLEERRASAPDTDAGDGLDGGPEPDHRDDR